MYFINLDKLKIVKGYNFETREEDLITDLPNTGIKKLSLMAKEAAEKMCTVLPAIECNYVFNINPDDTSAADDLDAEDFLTAVNVIISAFFEVITTEQKRDREYRLDVPGKLKGIKMSLSTLKKAINSKTIVDNFNLTVHYKDLVFVLCDEKEIEETKNWTDIEDEGELDA